MIVKDINGYIRFLTDGKPTEQLGQQQTDPLLLELMGSGQSFDDYLRDLYDFAIKPDVQVFYEMLQNANDEKASHIYFYITESAFLVVNNGLPFETNGCEQRQLRHFLAKGQGNKSKDPEATGEKGRGSKLLYNLLLNQELSLEESSFQKQEDQRRGALIKGLKGPIIFSWNGLEQLEYFRYTASTEDFNFSGDYASQSIPLLTKLIYSYYPAYLNEELSTYIGEKSNLFPTIELEQCRNIVNEAFSQTTMFPTFSRGTLIYLPLGIGKANKLNRILKNDIYSGVASSMPFLKNLKTVRLQRQEIYRSEYIHLPLETDGKEPFELLIPVTYQEELFNFYQTFPIVDTKLGLQFIINAKNYTITGGRQRIDLDPYNRQELEAISAAIISFIEEPSHRTKCIALLSSLIHAEQKTLGQQDTFYIKYFYEELKLAFQRALPTENGDIQREKNKVKLLQFSGTLVIKPEDLGIEEVQWLDRSVVGTPEDVTDFLKIESWTIVDILVKAAPPSRAKWLHALNPTEYQEILQAIQDTGSTSEALQQVPFFRFSEENAYSWNEILKLESAFLLDSRTLPLKELLRNHHVTFGGVDVLYSEDLAKTVESWQPDAALFTRIQALISKIETDPDSVLSRAEKECIWRTLTKLSELSWVQLRNELSLFTNTQGVSRPLSQLVHGPREKSPSGLLQFAKLNPAEYQPTLDDTYLLQSEEQWQLIKANWQLATSEVLSNEELYPTSLSELTAIYDKREKEEDAAQLERDVSWVHCSTGEVLSIEKCFVHPQAVKLSSEEHEAYASLIERISDLSCPKQPFLRAIMEVPFAQKNKASWELLSEKWKEEVHAVTEKEIAILSKLGTGFFRNFILYFDEATWWLRLKGPKEFQYVCVDQWVNKRLEQENKFYLLGASLGSYFGEDDSLLRPEHGLLSKLMDEVGAAHDFVQLLDQVDDSDVRKRYFSKLEELQLNSSDARQNLVDDIEGKVIRWLNKATKLEYLTREQAQAKITIDGKPLSTYVYSNDVIVKSEIDPGTKYEFKLSDLLAEYTEKARTFEQIRQKLWGVRGQVLTAVPMDSVEVWGSLKKLKGFQHPEQVAFLVAYALANDLDTLGVEKSVFAHLTDQHILQSLFQHEIHRFDRYSVFSNLQLRQCVPAHLEEQLKLPREQSPTWLDDWIGEKTDSKAKRTYLHKNGWPNEESKIILLRRALLKNTFSGHHADESIEAHPVLAENTFEWFSQQVNAPILIDGNIASCLKRLCSAYYEKHRAVPMLLTYQNIEELTLTTFDPARVISALSDAVKKEELEVWVDISKELQRPLLFNGLAGTFHDCFPILSISSTYSQVQQTEPRHWDANYYRDWRNIEAPDFKIFTTPNLIALDYSYTLDEEQKPFQMYERGECCRQEVDENKVEIFLHLEEGGSVLDRLHLHRETLFTSLEEKDKLSTLQAYALRELEKRSISVTDNDIDSEHGQVVPDETEVKPNEIQPSGEVIEGLDQVTKDKIQENLEAVQGIIRAFNADVLEQLAKADSSMIKDILDQENDQATPNQIIGYIGECLIYNYLKFLQKGTNIKWTAVQNPPTPEYDITLEYDNRRFLIDVKTTIKPVKDLHEAAAFYIKRSQLEFMKDEQPENYWIIRISLKDLGLEGVYYDLKELMGYASHEQIIEKHSSTIKQRVDSFLSKEGAATLIRKWMLDFRVSRPARGEGVPF